MVNQRSLDSGIGITYAESPRSSSLNLSACTAASVILARGVWRRAREEVVSAALNVRPVSSYVCESGRRLIGIALYSDRTKIIFAISAFSS